MKDRPPGQVASLILPSMFSAFAAWLTGLALHQRFAIVGSVVSLLGMIVIGSWMSAKIETGVVHNSAISAAVFVESSIAPLSQELAQDAELSRESRNRLIALLGQHEIAVRIKSVKIWKSEGLIAFASDPELIGKRFELSEDLNAALAGQLVAEFNELDELESASEQASGLPLIEVYVPVHSAVTGEIIAVAEFYLIATELERDLISARRTSWALVAAVSGLTFAALFGFVRSASRTIEQQHLLLKKRLEDVTRVSTQNADLRTRMQEASQRVTAVNEGYLRRLGAELHDGPAQALSLVNLRIGALKPAVADESALQEFDLIHGCLDEALGSIRSLSRGLILPELEGLGPVEIIQIATQAHEGRTRTEVTLDGQPIEVRGEPLTPAHAICLYRFVQEGLMNAFRHADGKDQSVSWRPLDGVFDFEISVSDNGGGLDIEKLASSDRLGIRALRERVESVGGAFDITSQEGLGTRLTIRLRLKGAT